MLFDRTTLTEDESSIIEELRVSDKGTVFLKYRKNGRYYAYENASAVTDQLVTEEAASPGMSIGSFLNKNLTGLSARAKFEPFEFTHEMSTKKAQ